MDYKIIKKDAFTVVANAKMFSYEGAMDAVLYIHGKGDSAEEAKHYMPLFQSCEVTGFDYKGNTPWETGEVHGT